MINKFFAFFVFAVLLLNSFGATFAGTKAGKSKSAQTGGLVSFLPPSDMAVSFDAKEFFETALPQVLANNQPLLAEITGKIDEFKQKIGIDARQFENIAVGVSVKQLAANDFDVAPVILMRGSQVNAGALASMLKLLGDKNIKEEKIGGKSVYTVNTNDTPIAKKKSPVAAGKNGDAFDRAFDRMFAQISVTAFDDNTVAVGTPARVRQLLTSKLRIAPDVSGLLARNPNAVLSFSAKLPFALSKFIPLDSDELGKNIDSIKYIFGSADAGDGNAKINLSAKTLTAAQAQSLADTIGGLQILGKAFLGDAKSEEKQVYSRLLENVKISHKLSEVSIDLQIPQSDIDILVKKKEKPAEVPNAADQSGK